MSRGKLIAGILATFLGISLVVFLVALLDTVGEPYELILGEGFLLYQADLIAKGLPLYERLTSTSFLVIPHTPLYVFICGWISRITGSTILVGRSLSLACGFGLSVLIFLLVRDWTKSSVAGVLAGLVLVSTYVFRFLAPLYRMDVMGILFSLLGIYWVTRFEGRGKLIYWAVPFLVAGFFTKQYFMAAPIAICVYLLMKNREWGPAMRFGRVYLGVLGGALLIGGLLTNWELIIHNFIYLGFQSRMEWFVFVGAVRQMAFYHGPLLAAISGYFGYKIYRRESLGLVDVYFLVSVAVMLAACGKRGGGFHYGLELIVVGCVLVGVLLARFFTILKQKVVDLKQVLLGGSLVAAICLQVLGFPLGQGFVNYRFLDTAKGGNQQLLDIIASTEGYIFADRVASPMVVGGNPERWIAWEPALLFVGKLYEKEGRFGWDQTELVKRLESGYYELVIAPHDIERTWTLDPSRKRWIRIYRDKLSPEVAHAILDNFELELVTWKVGTNWCPWRHYVYEYKGNTNRD